MRLHIDKLHKKFDQDDVLNDVSMELESGQVACLVGPSGCGKTTLLRCVAGFESIHQGSISLNDQVVSSAGRTVAPEKREIGMVFQDHSLFPHMTIAQNVAFGLHQWSPSQRSARVLEVVELVGLASLSERYPHQLSGGQQQRAALARALAYRPNLLLMDEPFSSLDQELRQRLVLEVSEILRASQTTTLWVTHDQNEALQSADVIGVMAQGELLQWSTPDMVYRNPANRFVAEFLGECAFLPGQVITDDTVKTVLGELPWIAHSRPPSVGSDVEVLLRAGQLCRANEGVPARVDKALFEGDQILYRLTVEGRSLMMRVSSSQIMRPGDTLHIKWCGSNTAIFAQEK